MKNALLFSLAISFSIKLFSQYHPLIDETKKWVVFKVDDNIQTTYPDYTKVYYFGFFKGDTLVNNVHYSKYYTQDFYKEWHYYPNPYHLNDTLQNPSLGGLFREDTTVKQVYKLVNNTEELWFDFSLQVGDSIQLSFLNQLCGNNYTSVVDSTKVISLKNGDKRNILYYEHCSSTLNSHEWIEGIGSQFGILDAYLWVGLGFNVGGNELVCYSDGVTNFYGRCDYPSYVSNIKLLDQVNYLAVYPNPVKETLFLRGKKNYFIFNVSGQLIMKGYGESIDVSGLQKGLFTIEVTDSEGKMQIHKFLKD